MRYHVIFNTQAGLYRLRGQDYIAGLVRDYLDHKLAELDFVAPQNMNAAFEKACAQAGDHCTVLVGGGDGTLRNAVKQAWYNNHSFGPLPGGTFNALTRHLGLGHDLKTALQAYAENDINDKPLSIGTINHEPFIEAVSFNIDRAYLGKRKDWLRRFHLSQAFRIAVAYPQSIYGLLHDSRDYQYDLDRRAISGSAKALRVTNNAFEPDRYVFDLFKDRSSRMNTGQLGVYSFSPETWYDFYRVARGMLGNRSLHEMPITAETTQQLAVTHANRQKIGLYIDGDRHIMDQPLYFTAVKDAVRLQVPMQPSRPC